MSKKKKQRKKAKKAMKKYLSTARDISRMSTPYIVDVLTASAIIDMYRIAYARMQCLALQEKLDEYRKRVKEALDE